MDNRFVEDVYDTLRGVMVPQARVADVEMIISCLMEIERKISWKMYRCGAIFGMEKE